MVHWYCLAPEATSSKLWLHWILLFMDKFMSADTDQSPQIHLDLEQNVTEYYSFPRSSY